MERKNNEVIIGGEIYTYIRDIHDNGNIRKRYFQLANEIFCLDFEKWYQSGYMDNHFIPYVIMHEGRAVSSVAVCINDISFNDLNKRYVQISTVMTLPEYRNKGLSRFLLNTVLNEWKDKCDAIYLFANDSVVEFYPKFEFEEFKEYRYNKPIIKANGTYRKLNINDPEDWDLILKHYELNNPYSEFKVDNPGAFVFHCMLSVPENIYYIDQYNAVAVVEHDNNIMTCRDIFTDSQAPMEDIIRILAKENTDTVCLGFTPLSKEGYIIEEAQDENTHLFVLKGKENIYKDNKVMLTMLSRA